MAIENENENRETIDDIVFELREHDHEMIPPYLCFDEEGGVMIGALADRIEAAWARESKAIATEHAVLPAVCITKQQGNAAATREALERLRTEIERFYNNEWIPYDAWQGCDDVIRHALSAPARNCDRFKTRKDAMAYFDNFVCLRSNGSGAIECKGCPLDSIDNPHRADCREGWFFAPATERKGE